MSIRPSSFLTSSKARFAFDSARTFPRCTMSARGRCSSFLRTCLTRPPRLKTPMISTSSARRVRTGSKDRTPTSEAGSDVRRERSLRHQLLLDGAPGTEGGRDLLRRGAPSFGSRGGAGLQPRPDRRALLPLVRWDDAEPDRVSLRGGVPDKARAPGDRRGPAWLQP